MTLTLVQAWTRAKSRLEAAGLAGPVIDARLLVEAAADATRADIVTDPHRELTPDQEARLDGFLARRVAREPVSHILGRKGFWKIMLHVTPDVLTPRPDTETVVEYALRDFPENAPWRILDLGVGSGAILLALLAERPAANGLGIEISEEALAVARDNAASLGLAGRLALLRGDWTAGLEGDAFDLVVANPPYIATEVIATLEPEVRDHEPRIALEGGADGLDHYRVLAPEILRVLKPGGRFAVEIGYDQKDAVEALFREAGAVFVQTIRDLADRDRVVAGEKKTLETVG
ncbi:peptide chain release factor N(5)-glutamine methyltransferase [Phenylobacterium sp.]|uniref:peptide chain release factor N(5)-glutamine methyltransferase n=1 Tax=Phenylobacterium sp. TaxID=1871053 RepID=UPI0025F368D1|nr:peptide chain release factor N(5)-glutamine methyltransferase [Phenylobacterium sp.]MBX3485679.1 peptide chain release factor N(5)-glutamine methyltransferase [Phenylobacterium sp.]MCW5759761.1 peptide chain release factor N(5)-glutamine methyltransferase [Phenylobacterium sp.]